MLGNQPETVPLSQYLLTILQICQPSIDLPGLFLVLETLPKELPPGASSSGPVTDTVECTVGSLHAL